MKKYLALILSLILMLTAFAACTQTTNDPTEKVSDSDVVTPADAVENVTPSDVTTIRVAGMKGPTSIGMVKIMEDNTESGKYAFTIAGTADEIAPKLIKGELDIAAVPANLASVLYNKTNGAVSVLAVNTLGVLYIVEKGDSVNSLADLKGKTIYATGKGTTPEYSLRYLLTENGIDPDNDVTIEFRSEATEIVSVLATAEDGIALLPQPYVTVASQKVEGLRTAINLNDEWNKLDNGSKLVTGVVVARNEFIENNPDAVTAFLDEYKQSVDYVNNNVEAAAVLVEKFDIFAAAVAKIAIPQCNIVFLDGEEMKEALTSYLTILYNQNPASIGGNLPGEDFCY
ncbi:MAG: ABC transporter substrate-binding protein [Ruminococcaceae bacterium]|nr:ABC transporter substrate-binding protein [Oscillospiraceae bacterium]